jgi:hypothetical protein
MVYWLKREIGMPEGQGLILKRVESFFAHFSFLCFIIHLTFIFGRQMEYQFGRSLERTFRRPKQ